MVYSTNPVGKLPASLSRPTGCSSTPIRDSPFRRSSHGLDSSILIFPFISRFPLAYAHRPLLPVAGSLGCSYFHHPPMQSNQTPRMMIPHVSRRGYAKKYLSKPASQSVPPRKGSGLSKRGMFRATREVPFPVCDWPWSWTPIAAEFEPRRRWAVLSSGR